MLTPADELHVHQTPEPIAAAGTDRNFYDRSYFGGWSQDGSVLVAGAFGVYPQLNVADAHLTIVRDGVQHCLHASRVLEDRTRLDVGPASIEVLQPLRDVAFTVAETEGLGASLTFRGRHAPLEEPRFIHRAGTRAFMDATRMSQAARLSGHVVVEGERIELGDGRGFRDRSWGIRPIGTADPAPPVPAVLPQFFWIWSPIHWEDHTTFFHVNHDAVGRPWNERAAWAPDGDGELEHGHGRLSLDLQPGTRWPTGARLELRQDRGPAADAEVVLEPVAHLEMRGIGYRHPTWVHGAYQGELVVETERVVLADRDPTDPSAWHRQLLCRATGTGADGTVREGMGFFEHLVIGPYAPLGLTGMEMSP